MKLHKEKSDKYDRLFKDNAFAKAYKAKNDAQGFVGRNSKSKALKGKSKIIGNIYE